MKRDYPGDYDSIRCEGCEETYPRKVMSSREITDSKGTSMCGFFCPNCR